MTITRLPALTIAYGIFLILAVLAAHLMSTDGRTTVLLVCTGGGAVCALLGVVGLRGSPFLARTILTLVIVNFVLLAEVVFGWAEELEGEPGGNFSRALLTLMLAVSIGVVAYLANAADRQRPGVGRSSTRP
jgi:hypothetical protein